MKINSIKFTNIDKVYKTKNLGVENINNNKNNKSDSVQISDLGKYLNEVNINKEDMNMDKVNDIKKRIENGTYSVDSKALAKKIIERMKGDNN